MERVFCALYALFGIGLFCSGIGLILGFNARAAFYSLAVKVEHTFAYLDPIKTLGVLLLLVGALIATVCIAGLIPSKK